MNLNYKHIAAKNVLVPAHKAQRKSQNANAIDGNGFKGKSSEDNNA